MSNTPKENPYLAHLKIPSMAAYTDPFDGYIPRKVHAAKAKEILDGDTNPFRRQPYSDNYKKILESRKKLPVFTRMEEFYKIFNANQIVVIIGETGSGKTTQIPQFVAYTDIPHVRGKIIACTQPRRVAAMSAAKRVSEEMDVQLGKQVGYSIRFSDMTETGTTFLKYITDGMLLREAMNDRDLTRYSTIILDEAHERTLATDILMGLLKEIAKRRSDLKIIVMSATLDAPKFQNYFSTRNDGTVAPLLKVPGRTFPVEILYTRTLGPDYLKGAIETVLTIHQAEDEGDILVFLTGEEEIEDACRRIRTEAENLDSSKKDRPGPLMCVPLHSSLPLAQQQRVFDPPPPGGRKVVVSDNVAETGLTIGGIVYVVDPGFSKQKVYNPRSQMESLFVSPISQASAQQRAGRAGRTRPGKCFRLYTERDYGVELVGQTPPEILRLNLANTVLQLLKLGVANLAQFDYMDAPAPGMVTCALELLRVLSALDDDGNLTSLGGIMAEFPLEPQLAKVLIVSPEFRCSNELLSIVAMLSVPNVWLRPDNRRKEADAAKRVFTVPDSDHLTLMNVYNEYVNNKGDKKWCWNHYLSQSALQQAENVRQQLERSMERFDLDLVSQTDKRKLFTSIRQALVCGLFMQVVHRGAKDRYVIVKDDPVVSLHPSCGLDNTPEWVLFNEFVPTPRPYIRTVTNIQPEWLLEYAGMHYDLADFPESEAKRALQHVVQKKLGKVENGGRKVERKTKKAWR